MKRTFFAAALIALTLPTFAFGAQPDGICSMLLSAYDSASMSTSMMINQARIDSSAPRASVKQAEVLSYMLAKQMNLTLMVENKCALPKGVYVDEFPLAAGKCGLEELKGNIQSSACDVKTWKRDQGGFAAK